MSRPRLLDLFCCQGGAAAGYAAAGFDVVGIDIAPQPRYPFAFHRSDAIAYAMTWGGEFDFIHASPPCQHDSDCQRIMDREHPDLIAPTRSVRERTGLPFVIENVGGAVPKLRNSVELCGQMFGLSRTYRHRYFETGGGFSIKPPEHPAHTAPQVKMGRTAASGEVIQAVGNFAGVGIIRTEWDVPWMNRDGIREAIPPAYAEFIGRQAMAFVCREPRTTNHVCKEKR